MNSIMNKYNWKQHIGSGEKATVGFVRLLYFMEKKKTPNKIMLEVKSFPESSWFNILHI